MGLAYLNSLLKSLASLNQAADLILYKYVRIICFWWLLPSIKSQSPPSQLLLPSTCSYHSSPSLCQENFSCLWLQEPSAPSQCTRLGPCLESLLALACYTHLGLSAKDTVSLFLLPHLSLLNFQVSSWAAWFVHYNYKSHTGVPGNFSWPTWALVTWEGTPFLCDLEHFSPWLVSHSTWGRPWWKFLWQWLFITSAQLAFPCLPQELQSHVSCPQLLPAAPALSSHWRYRNSLRQSFIFPPLSPLWTTNSLASVQLNGQKLAPLVSKFSHTVATAMARVNGRDLL